MRKWEGIEEFVAVTETNSFTAAAKRLTVSTAHVSRQITSALGSDHSNLLY